MPQDHPKPFRFLSATAAVIAILSLGLIVYSNTFLNSFHFDDYTEIVSNAAIKNVNHWHDIWNFWPTRFIAYYSFALNYHYGGLDVRGYHGLSLMIHLGTSLLVWWLVRLIFSLPGMRQERIWPYASWIAFFSGVIFLSHPLQTQPVNYIFQRAVLLEAFFYLGSLIFFIKARLACQENSRGANWRIFYILSLAFAVLSLFSKETAITLPLMICLFEFCFFKTADRFKWGMVIPYLAILLLLPITWVSVHPEIFKGVKTAVQGYAGGMTVGKYFLTQLKVLTTYIRLLVIPIHQTVEYDYPLAKSLFDMPVILSLLFLLGMLVFAFKVFNQCRMVFFGIFWFFITLLPESSIWPNQDVIFEHRLYLPMMGFSVLISCGFFYLLGEKNNSLAIRLLFLIVLIYSVMTYQRNKVWLNELTLWDDAVHQSPKDARAYLNRGAAYQTRGDMDHALEDYNMVIGLGPVTAVTLSNRGLIFHQKGEDDLALANFNLAIKINPNYAGTYVNRGLLYKAEGKWELAFEDLKKAVTLIPNDADALKDLQEIRMEDKGDGHI